MFVKLCGLRSEADVVGARVAGADAIGLNLTAASRRRVDADAARLLADKAQTLIVVWVIDASPPAELTDLVADFPKSFVQRTDAAWAWPSWIAPERRIGVVRLPDTAATEQYVISDAPGSAGGSGKRADWVLTAALAKNHPRVLLAGGLDAENVADAIQQVAPFGVDVASGIEREVRPDPARMTAFVRAAKGVR